MIWLAVALVYLYAVESIVRSFPMSARLVNASQHADGNAVVLLALDCSTPSKEHVL